jgi:hypothetical protein
MGRRMQDRPERTVRVQFEATRLSERVMVEAYEQIVSIHRRRCRPACSTPPEEAAVLSPVSTPTRR